MKPFEYPVEWSEVFKFLEDLGGETHERKMTAGRMSIALPKSFFPLTWTEWKVAPGQSVGRGTVLGLYARSAGGRMSELRAEGPGTVEELLVTAGEMLNESRCGILLFECRSKYLQHSINATGPLAL